MDERIVKFIDSLRENLKGLPDEEVRQAVSYYEEYLSDAAEAGQDIDKLLAQIGPPEEVCSSIRVETSIIRAKRSPGLKNFTSAMKFAFREIKTPLSFIWVPVFILLSYSLVFTFAAGAVVTVIGAVAALAYSIYETSGISPEFVMEKIGTVGIGLLAAGICLLTAFCFYKLCRLLISVSASVIQRFRKRKPGMARGSGTAVRNPKSSIHASNHASKAAANDTSKAAAYNASKTAANDTESAAHDPQAGSAVSIGVKTGTSGKLSGIGRKLAGINKTRLTVRLLIIAIAAGFLLFLVSGLPYRYFIIFNSMKPPKVTIKTMEFNAADIKTITLTTEHSGINIKQGGSDRLSLTYEQPDWLEFSSASTGGTLSFNEKSNGRLSFFRLISIHESATELTLIIPAGYDADKIILESSGGQISIDGISDDLEAKTYTGAIKLHNPVAVDKTNIKAATGSGSILVNGKPAASTSGNVSEYSYNAGSGVTINMQSSAGSIYIETD